MTDPSPLPFFCPVCNHPVDGWLPFTRLVGENKTRTEPGGRLCPHCQSFERTRHFWLFLQQHHILETPTRFLHVAPEQGLLPLLRRHLGSQYITMDLYMPEVDLRADLTAIPLEDQAVDFIYCSNVLEHIPRDRVAMKELARVLRKGGQAYLQVPIQGETTQEDLSITSPEERARLYGQADHVRQYGRDIRLRLEEAGFAVRELYMPDALQLTAADTARYNCAKRELVHLCQRP